jgi:hypothetical protein
MIAIETIGVGIFLLMVATALYLLEPARNKYRRKYAEGGCTDCNDRWCPCLDKQMEEQQ